MPNTPSHILYHAKATGKDKAGKKIWPRVGAAWPNKSGNGFNLTWEYLPLGFRYVCCHVPHPLRRASCTCGRLPDATSGG